ncbi:MAG: hypothetical protein ACD_75C02630G0005 [uncultured bacterium]|nr:MAG: hypothetical protein ACD_75C02630G0005 [uncultured bacterium]
MMLLLQGAEIFNLGHDNSVIYLAVRGLDKSVRVDSRIGGQGNNQPNVGTFGCFNRTDPAVVGRMHVTYFETGSLSRQTAGSESTEPPLVGHL